MSQKFTCLTYKTFFKNFLISFPTDIRNETGNSLPADHSAYIPFHICKIGKPDHISYPDQHFLGNTWSLTDPDWLLGGSDLSWDQSGLLNCFSWSNPTARLKGQVKIGSGCQDILP